MTSAVGKGNPLRLLFIAFIKLYSRLDSVGQYCYTSLKVLRLHIAVELASVEHTWNVRLSESCLTGEVLT